MVQQFQIKLPPFKRGFHIITSHILESLGANLPKTGVCHVHIMHTSAGLCINENADPDVRVDFQSFFNRLVPDETSYFIHTLEGLDDMPAHIKSSLLGHSVTIPVTNGSFNLGTWQGIYLCEFRNQGGSRVLTITTYGD